MPLGHQLRADDEIIMPGLDIGERIPEQGAARQIARQHADAGFQKARGGFFRQPLDARSHRHHLARRLALGASLRHRLQMAAMVAHQLLAEAMLDERGRTIGTFQPMPAGPAQRQRRIAPAVEEQQRLIARGQRGGHSFEQRVRNPGTGLQFDALHVDERNLRQFRPSMPVLQFHHAIAPAIDIDQRLE